jgi:hypothetical protein
MTKRTNKTDPKKALDKWERMTSSPGFDEAAFEQENFSPLDESVERGLVDFCDGKGNWRNVNPPIRVTLNLSPAIKQRAESLDSALNMGYQNVLKAAMFLGIKELESKAAASRS